MMITSFMVIITLLSCCCCCCYSYSHTLTSCLSNNSVPSLVILGAAKGGTTDIWSLLSTHHSLFNNNKRVVNKKEVNKRVVNKKKSKIDDDIKKNKMKKNNNKKKRNVMKYDENNNNESMKRQLMNNNNNNNSKYDVNDDEVRRLWKIEKEVNLLTPGICGLKQQEKEQQEVQHLVTRVCEFQQHQYQPQEGDLVDFCSNYYQDKRKLNYHFILELCKKQQRYNREQQHLVVDLCNKHQQQQDNNKKCSAYDIYVMLRCQRKLAISENISGCHDFFKKHHSISFQYEYTMTARPTLLFLYTKASQLFQQLMDDTRTPSLFMVLLRNPVDRTISLYNHGQMQKLALNPHVSVDNVFSVGYSMPLEEVLDIEFNILSSNCKEYLKNIQLMSTELKYINDDIIFFKYLKRIGNSFDRLRHCMYEKLQQYNNQQHHKDDRRVNLRPSGLLLEGIYGAQLSGWLGSGLFHDNKNLTPSRILIAQSELLFKDRIQFFNDILLPFLHPVGCIKTSHDQEVLQDSYIVHNVTSSTSSEHKRLNKRDKINKIANQKLNKLPCSVISSDMRKRLLLFYQEYFPLSNLLEGLKRLAETKRVHKFYTLAPEETAWW